MSCNCVSASRTTSIASVPFVGTTLDAITVGGTIATATPIVVGAVGSVSVINPSNVVNATANLRLGPSTVSHALDAATVIDYDIRSWIEYSVNGGAFANPDASLVSLYRGGVTGFTLFSGITTSLYLEQFVVLPAATLTVDWRVMTQYENETGPVAGVLDSLGYQSVYGELDLYVA